MTSYWALSKIKSTRITPFQIPDNAYNIYHEIHSEIFSNISQTPQGQPTFSVANIESI